MWKITKLDPATRTVSLLNHKGEKLTVIIPEEHKTIEQKHAHLKIHTDAHDNRQKNIKRALIFVAIVHFCIAITAIYVKLKG